MPTITPALTAEAGVTLAAVQQAARDAGRLFPLSLGAEGSCQIGGNLATNAGGINVLRYGNARDLTLGLQVVLPDGRVWDGLRGLRKDNTGYDLKQLFIGSEGTLGIITAAVLKLFRRPGPAPRRWPRSPMWHRPALLRELKQALGDRLVGFELMSAFSLRGVPQALRRPPDPLPGHPWYALVQADDSAADSPPAAQLSRRSRPLERGQALDATVAQSGEQANALWALRENIAEAQRRDGRTSSTTFPSRCRRSRASRRRGGRAHGRAARCPFQTFGHLGDGNFHYNLAAPDGVALEAFMASAPRRRTASSMTRGCARRQHQRRARIDNRNARSWCGTRAASSSSSMRGSRPRSIRPASNPGKVL
jgi:FAD/FMN-containing dehydrogenase